MRILTSLCLMSVAIGGSTYAQNNVLQQLSLKSDDGSEQHVKPIQKSDQQKRMEAIEAQVDQFIQAYAQYGMSINAEDLYQEFYQRYMLQLEALRSEEQSFDATCNRIMRRSVAAASLYPCCPNVVMQLATWSDDISWDYTNIAKLGGYVSLLVGVIGYEIVDYLACRTFAQQQDDVYKSLDAIVALMSQSQDTSSSQDGREQLDSHEASEAEQAETQNIN